jgi:ABC-type glutathione transport system ATPase component
MSGGATAVLEVGGLDVAYGQGARRKQVVTNAKFRIAPGEVVGLIGETGSGKSTIARAVLGLVPTAAGAIAFDGELIGALSPARRRAFRRSGVLQYVFQDPLRSLDPDITLHDSVAEPLVVRGGLRRAEVSDRVREAFGRVRLDESLLHRLPGQVSGGQRQRAAIARALVTDPRLLILDEPVSALDSANRVQILELLRELADPSVALLFISHDLGSVAGITDRVLVLYRGRIVEAGATETVINRPNHPYTKLLIGSAPTSPSAAETARGATAFAPSSSPTDTPTKEPSWSPRSPPVPASMRSTSPPDARPPRSTCSWSAPDPPGSEPPSNCAGTAWMSPWSTRPPRRPSPVPALSGIRPARWSSSASGASSIASGRSGPSRRSGITALC